MKVTENIINNKTEMHKTLSKPWYGNKTFCIWVLALDGGIAKVFKKENDFLDMIGEMTPKNISGEETVGRMRMFAGSRSHHKFEPHMNKSRKQTVLFARDIAAWLDDNTTKDRFDCLVLIAAPSMLGDLRSLLTEQTQIKIIAEVDKDLARLSEEDLFSFLKELIWF